MAYLVAGGVTVPVTLSAPRLRIKSVGGVRDAFSGVPRSSVRDNFRIWEAVETRWIPRATETTIIAALLGAPPISLTGDMAGSVTVVVGQDSIRRVETGRKIIGGSVVEAVRLSFDLLEDSPVA